MSQHETGLILGQPIKVGSIASVTDELLQQAQQHPAGYICFTTAHMLVSSLRDASIQTAYAGAEFVLPDGVPVAWGLQINGHPHAECISGPRLVPALLREAAHRGVPVGFYGGRPETLERMRANLARDLPTLKINFICSPPFRPLTAAEQQPLLDDIRRSGARLLFIGLGSPKQDLWMYRNTPTLPCVTLGVGAAFEFLSGEKYLPPHWVQRLGLTWFIRLCQEPRRLLVRNLYSPIFVLLYLWHRLFADRKQNQQPRAKTAARTPATNTRKRRQRGSVLVIGPGNGNGAGSHGRGGIASVIHLHARTDTWTRRRLRFLATFDDRSRAHKLRIALRAYLTAPFHLARVDAAHIHLAAETSLLRKMPFIVMARALRRPVVVHIHAPSPESLFTRTPRWARRYVFRSAARVIALSEGWAEVFRREEPRTRVVVLDNPVCPADETAPPTPNAFPVILFVGKLEARKGYRDLLCAAADLLTEFPCAQFWFAGHGELPQAAAYAEELGIERSVKLLGWVAAPELHALYRQATVFALPSYAEGVPMAVLEAMSHAVPVVCTPVGGLPELLQHNRNTLFVTPGAVDELTAALRALLADPATAGSIGRAGRDTARSRGTLEDTSQALEALYAEVLGEHAAPASISP